jgi:hypothetical protein
VNSHDRRATPTTIALFVRSLCYKPHWHADRERAKAALNVRWQQQQRTQMAQQPAGDGSFTRGRVTSIMQMPPASPTFGYATDHDLMIMSGSELGSSASSGTEDYDDSPIRRGRKTQKTRFDSPRASATKARSSSALVFNKPSSTSSVRHATAYTAFMRLHTLRLCHVVSPHQVRV